MKKVMFIYLLFTIVVNLSIVLLNYYNPIKSLFENLNRNQSLTISNYKVNPLGRISLGVFLDFSKESYQSGIVKFEELIDKKVSNLLVFVSWGDNLADKTYIPAIKNYLDIARSNKVSLTLTWEPWQINFSRLAEKQSQFSFESIIKGNWDFYIEDINNLFKEYSDVEVIIRFAHEMNTVEGTTVWYPWQGDSQGYKNSYRYLFNKFDSLGNVTFMWNPINYKGAANPDIYYPGDSFVDLIGMSVINIGEITDLSGVKQSWRSCDELIDSQYTILSKYNKKIHLVEIMSSNVGGDRKLWYSDCLNRIESSPLINNINFMQIDPTTVWSLPATDWRINADPLLLEVIKERLSSSLYR